MDERIQQRNEARCHNEWVRANYGVELIVTGKPTPIKRRLNWLRRWVFTKWW